MKKRKKTPMTPAPREENRPAMSGADRDFALELEAMFRAELGEAAPQDSAVLSSKPERQTPSVSTARGDSDRALGEDTAELNRMIDEILRLDPPFRDSPEAADTEAPAEPVPGVPDAASPAPAVPDTRAGAAASSGFWTHPGDLEGLRRRETSSAPRAEPPLVGAAPEPEAAAAETPSPQGEPAAAGPVPAPALTPVSAPEAEPVPAPAPADPEEVSPKSRQKRQHRSLWRRRPASEELPKPMPPHLQVPEAREAPPAPKPEPEEESAWGDDQLYSAIDAILGRQIFDPEPTAPETVSAGAAFQMAPAAAENPPISAEPPVPAEASAAAEEPAAVAEPRPEEAPAAETDPTPEETPHSTSVSVAEEEPAAEAAPAGKPEAAGEEAASAPRKSSTGKRLRSWLTDLMQDSEEDDWGPEPAPAEEGAPVKPDQKTRPSGKAPSAGLSLEDFLAVAVPMEEATPAVKPSPPEPPRPTGAGGFWKRRKKEKAAPEQTPEPVPRNTSPVLRPKQRAEQTPPAQMQRPQQTPPTPKQRAEQTPPAPKQATAAASPEKPSDRWRDQQVTVPPKSSTTVSTPPEDLSGLTPPASPRQRGEAVSAAAGSKTPAEPVPSASVRPPKRRPAPEPVPRQDLPSGRRPEEDPEPPEAPAVLHPEEAYRKYIKPIGAVGSRIVVTGFFALLALFFTLYLCLRWKFLPEVFSGGLTCYLLLALLLGMVITNWGTYSSAFREMVHGKFSLDTLICLATVFVGLDTFRAAEDSRATFTVVIGALLMLSLWGKYQLGLAFITTTKVLRDQEVSTGVVEVQDITKGSRGITRTEADVDAFMAKLETRDLMSRAMAVYALAAAIGAFALTLLITAGLKQSLFWTGALVFIGSIPLTGLLGYARLFYLLSIRLSESKAAICGYHGAEAFGGEHAILIGDEDLFPEGSLSLNGFKVYNGNPDRIIAYATAATRRSGSALFPLFDELLETHNGRHYSVDSFRFYDSGGIGATIMGDVVLLGSLDFMRRMGIHMDGGTKVRQAVYVSVDGELAAVFAVKYNPPESVRKGLAAIAGNRHFKGILVTRTFLGTPSFLRARFGVPTGSFTYPPTKERLRLSEEKMKREGDQGAVLVSDSFAGFAQAAAGGRVLRSATVLATVLSIVGGVIGIILMGVLAALRATETATAVNLLLYVLAWLLPTLLLTGWTKHF